MEKLILWLAALFTASGTVLGAFGLTITSALPPLPGSVVSSDTEQTTPDAEQETEAIVQEAKWGHLASDLLDDDTRIVYSEILQAYEQHTEKIRLTTLDPDLVEPAFRAVICDYGGMFWTDGYTLTQHTRGSRTVGLDFCPSYTCSLKQRLAFQEMVDDAVSLWLSDIDSSASDYEKVKYVYETLACNVHYNTDSQENQNILSVFLYGESVCNGYASAVQYLLTLLDVPCMIVYGTSENQAHAWNLVLIEEEPYFLDVTWGSALTEALGECSYAYLNLTDRDIAHTHTVDLPFQLPECTAADFSWYVRECLYFTDYEEDRIGQVLADAYQAGRRTVSLKFSSDELYLQVFDSFITYMEAARYCPGLQSISYVENRELGILSLQFY